VNDDPAFLDLVAKLGPVLAEVAKAAVAESIAAVPTTTYRPGVVQGVDAAGRTASVLLDGDSTATTVQVLDNLPWANARVMVKFVPPSAVILDGIISASPLPAGTLAPYAGPITVHADASTATPTSNQPPAGWLWCAGQAVNRTTYSALFAAIGTTYGTGDGSQTFNVPDLRGRMPIGMDNMGGSDAGRIGLANTLGTTGGTNTITTSHMPSHTHSGASHSHTVNSHTHSISSSGTHTHPNGWGTTYVAAPGATYPAAGSDTAVYTGAGGDHSHGGATGSASPGTDTQSGTTGSAGSGSEFLPPVIAVHWLIKA
jgi:microcystin-dependent protein